MSTSKLEACITRARLRHFIKALSALHFTSEGEGYYRYEGDPTRGRTYLNDGCGNHDVVGWNEAGIVVGAFEHEYVNLEEVGEDAAFWDAFPATLRPLGEELSAWYSPAINGAAWFDAATDVEGQEQYEERVQWLHATDEAKLIADWQEHFSISPAQMDLARSLARDTANGRHALTEAEIAVALAHPEGGDAPHPYAIAPVKKQLAAAGVDWP